MLPRRRLGHFLAFEQQSRSGEFGPMNDVLRLGTRGSTLAQWQAKWVATELRHAGFEVDIVLIRTQGDARSGPIGELGGQGVFTKEIQRALLDHRIDVAVHSLKDLPTEPVQGLEIVAVPPRESAGDALVSRDRVAFDQLPTGAVVGTGSMRRQAQLLHARGDLTVRGIRGNVETRLRHLDDGAYDALVMAEAGLKRLALSHRVTDVLPKSWMLPAIGQGALAVETRAGDQRTREKVACLDDSDTHSCVMAERVLLASLHGGCLAPVGAWGRVKEGQLFLDASVLHPQGTTRLSGHVVGLPEQSEEVGRKAADQLLSQGAGDLIAAARHD